MRKYYKILNNIINRTTYYKILTKYCKTLQNITKHLQHITTYYKILENIIQYSKILQKKILQNITKKILQHIFTK